MSPQISPQMSPQSNPQFLPAVSVIIPVYNGEIDLPELLTCLAAQTYARDRVEYLLVDNGSRDRTAELIQTAIAHHAPTGLTLRYLNETTIQSSYAARNTGIKAATGEILAFTDADCRPLPNWLSDLVQPFVDPAVGLVVGEVLALPGHTLLEAYAERYETLSQKHTLANTFLPYGQTANLAVRRQAFVKAGLFRPHMTTGGDADLCWRVQQSAPWTLFFAETAAVRHRHRSTLDELKKQWRRYGKSNRYLHELYGVSLMRELTPKEYLYRISRWLLKEIPSTAKKVITGQAKPSSFLDTPLGLFCHHARTEGQQQSKLPDNAHVIDHLPQPNPEPSVNTP
ncbi:MAG TPA: glycosyltransferase [Chroococcidiopsis sp.]